MDHNELLRRVQADSATELACDFVLNGVPAVFGNDATAYDTFRKKLASDLGLNPSEVWIVGSARAGYSLSPDTFGVPFSGGSDIDIVVANQEHFDSIWWTISEWAFPWPNRAWPKERKDACRPWTEACFSGWIAPTELKVPHQGVLIVPQPLAAIRVRWFNAMKELGRMSALAGHDCEVRVYRTIEHARRYHAWSLTQLRDQTKH